MPYSSPQVAPSTMTVDTAGFALITQSQLPEGTVVNNIQTNQVFYAEPVAGVMALVLKGGGAGISGGGTINKIAKFVGATAVGDSQITDNGAAIVAAAATTAALSGGTGVTVSATTGDVALSTASGFITAAASKDVTITVGAGNKIALNGAAFLGSFSVATLPAAPSLAFAFATDVRNLDSGAAYPAVQGSATAGVGGLVHRGANGTWYLMGTNIVAVA